jgi:hypothetical protein
LAEGAIFTDPDSLRRQSFYHYTAQALENVRRTLGVGFQ